MFEDSIDPAIVSLDDEDVPLAAAPSVLQEEPAAPEVDPAPASLLERAQQMVNTFKSLKTNEEKSAFLGLETALAK